MLVVGAGPVGLSTSGSAAPVLVVGAGPVGLTAALALRAQGLAVTVLETGAQGRPRPGSRAIFLHRESLVHLETCRPGLGWAVAGAGLEWRTKRTFWEGRQVYQHTYPPPDPAVLPHATNLPQVGTEALLLEAAVQAGARLVWDAEVAAVRSGPLGVEVAASDGRCWTAGYVIGADGARSAVRGQVGRTMEGDRSENQFVIVDVAQAGDERVLERVYHYRHPAVAGRNVLLVPFTGGWRVDLQCRAGDDAGSFASPAGLGTWIGAVLPGATASQVSWVSTYRFLQVVADRFVDDHRRVLLIGEAAHLFAPFGARGLNSGIADAVAAAATVRAAVDCDDGRQAASLVDQFDAERRAAALYNRDAAAQALRHMQGAGVRTACKRAGAAWLAGLGNRAGAASLARIGPRAGAAWLAGLGNRAGLWLDSAPYGPRAKEGRRGASGIY